MEHVFLTSKLDKEVVAEAKINDLKNWADNEVYEIIHDGGQQTVSVKWVITQKTEKNVLKVKARLVARGFEEEGEIRNELPISMKKSIRVALSVMVSKEWTCQSLDVKAAFLQGKTIDRDVFIKPPPKAGCEGYIWKLCTCVYGLVDASRIWHFRVKKELLNLGMSISTYDPALFFWHCNEQLQGVLAVHVDDFLFGGTELFKHTVIDKPKEIFDIRVESESVFQYVGSRMEQHNSYITLDQIEYISKVSPITITAERRSMKDAFVTEEERTSLRAVVGQYIELGCNPD